MSEDTALDNGEVRDAIASRLLTGAAELAERWLRRLREEPSLRPPHRLDRDGHAEPIPPIIERIGACIGERRPADDAELIDALQRHARGRFEDGFDVQEVLVESEVLGQVLYDAALEAVDPDLDAPPGAVLAAAADLHHLLATHATVVGGSFRELELDRRRESDRRLEHFGRALAHELKNPLGAAQGAAQILAEPALAEDEAQREHFTGMVVRNIDRARSLVDDVRALSRMRSAEDDGGPKAPLSEIAGRVVADLEPQAAERGVEIRLEDMPAVKVDSRRLELILTNLIGNAVKYADDDKADRWVRIRAAPEDDAWRVEVQDNGLGIPDEEREHVFQRFYRGSGSGLPGSGLGLAIAREAVEQLGGAIDVRSEAGTGSTFTFTLPPALRPQ